MEKDASLGSDPTSITTLNSPPPPLSPESDKSSQKYQEEFAANFASLYRSIFSPEFPSSLSLSPSPPSCSSPAAPVDITTEHRLTQARLVLEYNELKEHYELCLVRLQSLSTELESLHQENLDLRLANTKLLRLIQLSTPSSSSAAASQPAIPKLPSHRQISNFGRQGGVLESSHSERRNNVERTVLPKSISVRANGYCKMNQRSQGNRGASRHASHHRFTSQLNSESVPRKVSVATIGKGEKEAVELDVYRQGMLKTEICNKWQVTGTCPYGDHCQFAHGIDELRPVIRHPRYKTDVCRMIVTGSSCPYGHRCHFRHSLTDHERLLLPR